MTQLTVQNLPAGTKAATPDFSHPSATLDSPALSVMTDLTRRPAVTCRRDDSVQAAERLMKSAGVRLLFVVDSDNVIKGLVSNRDFNAGGALTAAAKTGVKRDELALAEIMTPAANIEAMDYAHVATAAVRDVVQLMRDRGRQHALVIEKDTDAQYRVRGIFSITRIGRQLGISIEASGFVQSFAEIERVMATPHHS